MIYYKTGEEIELIRTSNHLVARTLAEVGKAVKPGVSTLKLDGIASNFIQDHGARPAFLGYRGFPNTLCTSVNHQVVHGIPSKDELKEGDILSVDCGVILNGYYGDSAYTFGVGEVPGKINELMRVTRESLFKGIEQAVAGNRLGDIGYAIQVHAESAGYSVVREMVGHGIGKRLHEEPEVPNYGKRGSGIKLRSGLVIAIEPMINLGKKFIRQDNDGWTIRTADNSASAHYELTVAVRKNKADVLGTFDHIEESSSITN